MQHVGGLPLAQPPPCAGAHNDRLWPGWLLVGLACAARRSDHAIHNARRRACPRRVAMAGAPWDLTRRQVFAVGNEAADADSLVSAYAMAQLLEGAEVQAVALAQISRAEFRLRGDVLALFARAGSELLPDGSPAHMQFWDEVQWAGLCTVDKRSLILTDHNKMTTKVCEHFRGRVEWVLDHHANTHSYPDARVDIDEGLGSACTLVAEQFLARADAVPRELGVLLAGVILLDTRNFDPTEKKGTQRDRDAFDKLAVFVPPEGADAWYKSLMEARTNVSHLSVRELLMVDLKEVTTQGYVIAFASVPMSLPETCSKAGGPGVLLREASGLVVQRGYLALVGLYSKAEGRKSLTLTTRPCAASVEESVCEALVERLAGVPANLPEELRRNPLLEAQGVLEYGFQLEPYEKFRPLLAYSLRGTVSRKTLLPCAMNASSL